MAEGIIATRLEINDELPDAVTNFRLENKNSVAIGVQMTWSLPTENCSGVAIIRKENSAPVSFTDGVMVYDGTGTSFVDTDVVENTNYYYRIYTYNSRRQIQTISVVNNIVYKKVVRFIDLPLGSKIIENYLSSDSSIMYGYEHVKTNTNMVVASDILCDDKLNELSLSYEKAVAAINNTTIETQSHPTYFSSKSLVEMIDCNNGSFKEPSERIRFNGNNAPVSYWLNDTYNTKMAYCVEKKGDIVTSYKSQLQAAVMAIKYTNNALMRNEPDSKGRYQFLY